jgi:archaellum biogenesis protein FlaJ (TadC family)
MTTPMPEPSPAQPDEDLSDLLNEIRLLLPGTLLLVAFLIALPFNTGYTRVSQFDNAVYVALFLCAILSLLLFAAPAAQHRLMSPLRDRAAFKRSVNRQVIIGLIPLSAAITLATYLVISDVVNTLAAAIVAGIVGLTIASLWWVVPLNRRRRRRPGFWPWLGRRRSRCRGGRR